MSNIIFLNGSINAGKSTVAKILVTRLPNSAIVEIDALRAMIAWMPLEQAIPINLENALSIIKNLIGSGLNVIVPYPLSQKNYEYMLSGLDGTDCKISVFTLAPSLDKALTNRGSRELGDTEKKRIQHHYSIGIHNPSFGEVIDNSNQTPEVTADWILKKVNEN